MTNVKLGLALLCTLQFGCTFYTQCPDKGSTADTGGAPSSAGSGNAGSGDGPNLAKWVNATSNLAGLDSTCGNLSMVLAKGDRVLAGVNPGGLWATSDAGETWNEIAKGRGTDPIDASIVSMTVDPDHPETFWISGIYGANGVWRTDDDGDTFTVLGNARHNDRVSVDFSDPNREFLMAGGHEQSGVVWRSTDGGQNWEDVGAKFPPNTPVSSYPQVFSKKLVLFGSAGYNGGEPGIFRSTDMGETWERLSSNGGLGKPLLASNGHYFWPSDDGGVMKSEDQGMTWDEVLPPGSVWGTNPLVELPDHRIAALTQKDGIKISDDGLQTLQAVVEPTPFLTPSLTYSDSARAFFIAHADCGNVVLDDAVMRADFDYESASDSGE